MWLVVGFWDCGWIVRSFIFDTQLEFGLLVAEYFTHQVQGYSLGNML